MNQNKFSKRICQTATAMALAASSGMTMAWTSSQLQTAVDNGANYLSTQQSLSSGGLESQSITNLYTAETVIALRSANKLNRNYYNAVTWLENHASGNTDYLARKALALYMHGNNVYEDVVQLQGARLNPTNAPYYGWGLSGNYTQSALDTALVISALESTGSSNSTWRAHAYNTLYNLKLATGGWSVVGSSVADPLITAEVIIALTKIEPYLPGATTLINQSLPVVQAVTTSASSLTLAKAAYVLRLRGQTTQANTLIDTLVGRQVVANGSFDNNVYVTAATVRTMANALGLDSTNYHNSVTVNDAKLKNTINVALGKNLYDRIVYGEIRSLTTLDLRGTGITDLTGLQYAINLQHLYLDTGDIDVSMLTGIAGLTIHYNDYDVDGMLDSWEIAYFGNITSQNGSGDADGDGLTNLEEYQIGFDPAVQFQALPNNVVMYESKTVLVNGSDLIRDDFNPLLVNLSVTGTTNVNAPGTPSLTGGNIQFVANSVASTTTGATSYTISGSSKSNSGQLTYSVFDTGMLLTGTDDVDIVYSGGNGTDVRAGKGNDVIYDNAAGDDDYVFSDGDGKDRVVINDTVTPRVDRLVFEDATSDEINLYKDGKDLIVNVRNDDSDVTIVDALLNEKYHNVTAVEFSTGTPWDTTKLRASNDHIEAVAYSNVITLMPDTIQTLTTNDFVPKGTRYDFELVPGSETNGLVASYYWYVGIMVDFSLTSGATAGSFQYRITDRSNPTNTSVATVYLHVAANDVTGMTWMGDANDNVLAGTAGNDLFNAGPGFDIIDGMGGEDTVEFETGGDKDSYRILFDDGGFVSGDGPSDYGDTVDITSKPRNYVELRREGLDLVARLKETGESIRVLDYMMQPATISTALSLPNGLLPLKKIAFNGSEVTGNSFDTTTDSALVAAAVENATKSCSVGGVANSICVGTTGDDRVAGTGFDITGSSGDDVIFGLAGIDTISSLGGDDILYGGLGKDILGGGPGNDELYGDQGIDWLNPGVGSASDSNYLNGGAGRDYYQIAENSGSTVIDNFDLTIDASVLPKDVLWINGLGSSPSTILRSHVKLSRKADDLIVKIKVGATESSNTVLNFFSFSGFNSVDAMFPQVVTTTGSGPIIWSGYCIDETLTTQSQAGVSPEAGVNDMYCIPNRVLFDMTHDDTCSNPALDDDELVGYDGDDTINANCGNDTVYGGKGNDTIHGDAGDDYIDGGWAHDTLYGDAGNDTLVGNWGADTLYGGDGNDILYAPSFQAASILYGDKGNDQYIISDIEYQHEVHAVVSSDAGVDRITFTNTDSAPKNYWIYETNYGGATGSGNEDLAIAQIDGGGVVYILDWKVSDNQLNTIEINNGTDACVAFSIATPTNMQNYLAAIITAAGVDEPTVTEMLAAISSSTTYWTDTCTQ